MNRREFVRTSAGLVVAGSLPPLAAAASPTPIAPGPIVPGPIVPEPIAPAGFNAAMWSEYIAEEATKRSKLYRFVRHFPDWEGDLRLSKTVEIDGREFEVADSQYFGLEADRWEEAQSDPVMMRAYVKRVAVALAHGVDQEIVEAAGAIPLSPSHAAEIVAEIATKGLLCTHKLEDLTYVGQIAELELILYPETEEDRRVFREAYERMEPVPRHILTGRSIGGLLRHGCFVTPRT